MLPLNEIIAALYYVKCGPTSNARERATADLLIENLQSGKWVIGCADREVTRLVNEIIETDGNQPATQSSGDNRGSAAQKDSNSFADQPHETVEQAKTELYAALRGLDDVGDHAGSPHEAAENRFDYAVNRLIAAALAQGRAQQEVVACPICAVWTGFPVEVLEHIRERHAQQEAEITRLRLELRIYQNGDHVNQALVDDIERWRVESEQAIAAAEASLAQQEQEIQRLKDQSTWQDIATAPKDGSGVVVIDAGTPVVVHWSEQYEMWEDMNGDFCEPRHWMPLPPSPKDTK